MDWPLYFKQLCRTGDIEGNVAIVTLWTPMAVVEKHLSPKDYALLTQLYSKDVGINALLRGCLANKRLRYILVTGQDLSGSGHALLNLKQHGIDAQHAIIGSINAGIDKEIPVAAVENFRTHVEIIDLRSLKDFSQLSKTIAALEKKTAYGEPELFPEATIQPPAQFPSESTGFHIRAKTVGEGWLQALQAVLQLGAAKESQKGESQKELINLSITITQEDPDNIAWKPYFNFTQAELEQYYPQVLTPQAVETVHYTYGKRLMDFQGTDQIGLMIKELKQAPCSRRAVAVLWDVLQDSQSGEPPCFNLIQALVQDNKLFLTAFIRSNDMYDAWPRNAFALRKLQQKIAKETGFALGPLTTISGSAHVYQRSMKQAAGIMAGYPVLQHIQFDYPGQLNQDPRGNITFAIQEGIIITHLELDGKRLEEHTVKTAKEGMLWLTYRQKISDIFHAMYLGQELEKAELALKYGLAYVQDKPLKLK